MMNTYIISNYARLKTPLFLLPVFLLIVIVFFLFVYNALCIDEYIQIQKESFFFLNHNLAQYPNLQLNLTQLGDALIFLSFLGIFIVYAPRIWECLIPGLLICFVFSCTLKALFTVPRPAAVFDHNSFIIIGHTLRGHSSLPSGHSITIFTVLTVLLYAFMPARLKYKITWLFCVITIGLILAFTRVGVGAHYPIDVIAGSIVGYISGIAGIFISRKYNIRTWVNRKMYYAVFIVLFVVGCIFLISKITEQQLVIFYLSFTSLVISLYKIIKAYAKE
ncbi:MAG: phosphatase PAP2 family protein [Agriterribacter sp.]